MNQVDGILLVDKPEEWTSHDVCAFVRKRFRIKKVGHAGTLDPLATGLLVVLLGKCTKQSQLFSSSDKEYYGRMELGVKTSSHDRGGEVIETRPWESVTDAQIREQIKKFKGEIEQVPPMVSAVKHKGVPLYRLARKGMEVPRESRKVTVYKFEIEKKEGPYIYFSTHVSKGTYVRTLVHDLGEAVGSLATLNQLRRMASGPFHVDNSVTIEQLRKFTVADIRSKMIPHHATISYAYSQKHQSLPA